MDYRQLGADGPRVSLLGLGTMTWGEQNTAAEAFEQLDMAIGEGINLIDAAEMYPVPPRATTQGETEKILGQWLSRRGRHDDLVIATKVAGRSEGMPWLRGGPRLDAASIRAACDASLQRLGIECIDLYQVHWPQRATNFFGQLGYQAQPDPDPISIEETLGALAQLQAQGKIRHIGVSNETAWGVAEYLRVAEAQGLPRIVSVQNPYNLLNRSYEIALAEFAQRENVGLLAYSPLAFGVLSGKYADGQRPAGARLSLYERFSRYTNPQAQHATELYLRLAAEFSLNCAQMALAFINRQPFVRCNLIGATNLQQLRQNLDSAGLELPPEVLQKIAEIHQQHPNPAP